MDEQEKNYKKAESLKQNPKPYYGGLSTPMEKDWCNGWNKCIDFLLENGILNFDKIK